MMPHVPTPIRHPQKPVEVSIDAAIKGGEQAVGIIVGAFALFFLGIAGFYWLTELVNYIMKSKGW